MESEYVVTRLEESYSEENRMARLKQKRLRQMRNENEEKKVRMVKKEKEIE